MLAMLHSATRLLGSRPQRRRCRSRVCLRALWAGVWLSQLCSPGAFAQDESRAAAIRELKTYIANERQNGSLQDASPVFVVVEPEDTDSETSFTQNISDALSDLFAADELRICLACSIPRTRFGENRVTHVSASASLPEIRRRDAQLRGSGRAARTAIYVQEIGREISLQVLSVAEGSVLVSEIFPRRKDTVAAGTERISARFAVQQKARGWTLTHWFNDVIVYPSPHIAIDVVDQIGEQRNHLLGVSTSLWNPLLGVGVSYHYVLPNAFNATIGGKLLLALPNLVLSGILPDNPAGALLDPTFTPMLIARVPIPQTPFAVSAMASMAVDFGAIRAPQVGIGISMMDLPPALLLP